MKWASLAVCVAGLTTSAAGQEPKIDGAVVDRLAAEALKVWQSPGLAVVIVRGGETVHLKGYGTRQLGANAPVTPDTLFPLASCTKAFTSAVLATLVDEGKLRWDDPVRLHLPAFHLSDPNADALVTLRDLLTHRTGVPGHDLLWYRAPWKLDETLIRIGKLPLTGQFRGEYHYSTLMYISAGRAAAKATGAPWEELVRERLCNPLGMKSVAFTSAEAAKAADRAAGHTHGKDGKVVAMAECPLPEPSPAGSLFATPRDLAAWLKLHLADGVVDGKRIVSAAALGETKTAQTVMRKDETVGPVYPDSLQVSYGMGWVVYDHRGELVVAHGGVLDGFRTQVTLLPRRGVGFVLMNNLHQTRMNVALGNAIIDHVCGLPAKDWNGYFQKVEKDEDDVKRAEIDRRNRARVLGTRPWFTADRYAGDYHDAAYGAGKVTVKDGRLVWEWSSFRSPLDHFQDNVFRVTEGRFEDQLVEFRIGDNGPEAVRAMGVVFKRKP